MKAIVLYRPDSEHARATEEYVREFTRRTSKELQLQDIDRVEGARLVELYDIVRSPALIVLADDGQLLKLWFMDETPPLIDEVNAYIVEG